jgi:hypothetical protein
MIAGMKLRPFVFLTPVFGIAIAIGVFAATSGGNFFAPVQSFYGIVAGIIPLLIIAFAVEKALPSSSGKHGSIASCCSCSCWSANYAPCWVPRVRFDRRCPTSGSPTIRSQLQIAASTTGTLPSRRRQPT